VHEQARQLDLPNVPGGAIVAQLTARRITPHTNLAERNKHLPSPLRCFVGTRTSSLTIPGRVPASRESDSAREICAKIEHTSRPPRPPHGR
jgi:hypothetical protein